MPPSEHRRQYLREYMRAYRSKSFDKKALPSVLKIKPGKKDRKPKKTQEQLHAEWLTWKEEYQKTGDIHKVPRKFSIDPSLPKVEFNRAKVNRIGNRTEGMMRKSEGYALHLRADDYDFSRKTLCGWIVRGEGYIGHTNDVRLAVMPLCKRCRKTYESRNESRLELPSQSNAEKHAKTIESQYAVSVRAILDPLPDTEEVMLRLAGNTILDNRRSLVVTGEPQYHDVQHEKARRSDIDNEPFVDYETTGIDKTQKTWRIGLVYARLNGGPADGRIIKLRRTREPYTEKDQLWYKSENGRFIDGEWASTYTEIERDSKVIAQSEFPLPPVRCVATGAGCYWRRKIIDPRGMRREVRDGENTSYAARLGIYDYWWATNEEFRPVEVLLSK